MTAIPVHYAGLTKTKRPVTGNAIVGDLAAWVEKHYRMGWRRLTVTDPKNPQHVLGAIGPGGEGGGRVWWTESKGMT